MCYNLSYHTLYSCSCARRWESPSSIGSSKVSSWDASDSRYFLSNTYSQRSPKSSLQKFLSLHNTSDSVSNRIWWCHTPFGSSCLNLLSSSLISCHIKESLPSLMWSVHPSPHIFIYRSCSYHRTLPHLWLVNLNSLHHWLIDFGHILQKIKPQLWKQISENRSK